MKKQDFKVLKTKDLYPFPTIRFMWQKMKHCQS